jgi:hypothetical protein
VPQLILGYEIYDIPGLRQQFYEKLRMHLLPRIQEVHRLATGSSFDQNFVFAEGAVSHVFLRDEAIYSHPMIRINFTTYDIRRGEDIIKPASVKCNIMLLRDLDCDGTLNSDGSSSTSTPHFWYARVLGIFHANVVYSGPGQAHFNPSRLDFLWVRWYRTVNPSTYGWKTSSLEAVEFLDIHNDEAFGFVDPHDVLRGCHILPAFNYGRRHTHGSVGTSKFAKDKDDWKMYYIAR